MSNSSFDKKERLNIEMPRLLASKGKITHNRYRSQSINYVVSNPRYESCLPQQINASTLNVTDKNSWQTLVENKPTSPAFRGPTVIILDTIVFKPNNRKKLEQTIEEAKALLKYEDDWDDNGSLSTSNETFTFATSFLRKYADALACAHFSIDIPFIDITVDGGISLKWENDKAIFFIIFEKDATDFAYYYGENKNSKQPDKIKNGYKISDIVDDVLIAWMKKNIAYEEFIRSR